MAPSIPVQKTGNIQGSQLDMFASCELTGDGASMSTAHSLGHIPTKVWATPTGWTAVTVDFAEGTHTSTNVLFTVTSGVTYRAYAL